MKCYCKIIVTAIAIILQVFQYNGGNILAVITTQLQVVEMQ